MSEANAFLLAAGLGTRFKPLTLTYPKPSIPFLNVPMGFYQFRYLSHLQINKLVVNTFHLPEKVRSLYQNQPYFKNEIAFSDEKGEILGSAGGLKKASPLMDLSKPILMMNADEIYFAKDEAFLKKAYDQHITNKNLATLIAMKHPDAGKKFGSIWCDGKRVKNISKQSAPASMQDWHFIGAMFLSPEILNKIPDNKETNIFYDVLIKELNQKNVEIYPIDCNWYETGNLNDFLQATQGVLKNLTPELLNFISKYDASKIIESQQTKSLISESVQVAEENLIGYNVVGKTATNIPHQLTNAVLFGNEQLTITGQ